MDQWKISTHSRPVTEECDQTAWETGAKDEERVRVKAQSSLALLTQRLSNNPPQQRPSLYATDANKCKHFGTNKNARRHKYTHLYPCLPDIKSLLIKHLPSQSVHTPQQNFLLRSPGTEGAGHADREQYRKGLRPKPKSETKWWREGRNGWWVGDVQREAGRFPWLRDWIRCSK